MSTELPRLLLYQLMDAFEAFSHSEPLVKPQHRSLYYFLVGYARKRGNLTRFTMPYEVGMHGSAIGSWATYDAALRALHGWGFIHYTPGANRYKVPIVELTFRNPNDEKLAGSSQAYRLAHPVGLQNQSPTLAAPDEVEFQNRRPTDNSTANSTYNPSAVELQNWRPTDNSTDNPSGDIKKTFRRRTEKEAADAATLAPKSEKKIVGKSTPKLAAAPAEIAALDLPYPSPEFRELWATFCTTNTKQAKKPLSAFVLMLRKLAKYPEPFAVLMLEAAIQGDWSGVENTGTPRAFDEWQQQQARRPPARPMPPPSSPPLVAEPELNSAVVAQREAQRQADADERARHFRETQFTTNSA